MSSHFQVAYFAQEFLATFAQERWHTFAGISIDVARYVKNYLSTDFECYLWTDDIFQYNESVFETLLKSASLFDFGIMVATKDDFLTSRNVEFEAARDNIVFEYGLFLGRVGAGRAFVIQEEGTKLPSDLYGITTPRFQRTADLKDADKLNNELKRISKAVKEKMSIGELGLLPSTALAIGYFDNFVSLTCEALCTKGELIIEGNMFKEFEFNIIIPGDLDSDVKKHFNIFCSKHRLKQTQVQAAGRNYPISVSYKQGDSKLRIYDMPTTLNGIDRAIELYMRKGHVGKTPEQQLLEERELRNFTRVLRLLTNGDSYCKHLVNIVDEDNAVI